MQSTTNPAVTFLRRLLHFRGPLHSFESPRYLVKWLFLSSLIGIVAGLGAIAFFASIRLMTDLLLGQLVGYLPPSPAGEGQTVVMPLWAAARPWLLPLVTAAGGLLSGIIIFNFAPEAEGIAPMPPSARSITASPFAPVFP